MARVLPIGLDIGTTTVRMLQLAGSEDDVRLVDAAKYVVPQEAKRDPSGLREAVVEGIRGILRGRRFRRREAVMALKADELAVRSMRMAKMPEEELPTAVNWEVQNKFPFDTATAVVQYLRAGEVRHGDQVLDEIIVFVAPRAAVESKIELACDMGLDVVSLDAEPCAVFRGFERFLHRREDESVVTALVDIGSRTTVVIARGRDIIFVKTIPIGGAVFNRSVADCLELAPSEAEALRRRLARRSEEADPADPVCRAVTDCIRPPLEDLANEIGLCLRYYAVTFRGPRPESITFSGGEAHDPTIPRMLGERLGMEVTIGDPFRRIRTNHLGAIPDRRQCASEWATSLGLSLKGFALAGVAEAASAA
jgi:type IV pilus assembly protein PilM